MAATPKDKAAPAADVKSAEAANAEVQAKADIETEQGYRGVTNDPNPNSAYSILSGPDAPPVHAPKEN